MRPSSWRPIGCELPIQFVQKQVLGGAGSFPAHQASHDASLGLPLGLEAPVMTPNGVKKPFSFLFFSFCFSLLDASLICCVSKKRQAQPVFGHSNCCTRLPQLLMLSTEEQVRTVGKPGDEPSAQRASSAGKLHSDSSWPCCCWGPGPRPSPWAWGCVWQTTPGTRGRRWRTSHACRHFSRHSSHPE